ncbi:MULTISPECIES: potassium-transporting ATPase subunit C [Streptomyces]|uniref:potassium-transporting ATPase subunit C n=1 Tax=Streptomyces TaxID=1883 RepID=UPI000788B3FA|nr:MULTISPECIES: potassium-transporting ATPase subunit C [unclassified Streptomyces]AVH99780.1 potassium-transporting ATPase subunit C [Streptomyces sp. WAC00288]KYG57102.1 potassium-transporting ATPase subunit C [Streptomyces sp. WAC04657]
MNNSVRRTGRLLGAGLRALLVLTLVCGVLYPLAVTTVAQLAFPGRANGSEVRDGSGRVVGSSLVGQRYDLPAQDGEEAPGPDLRWFQPRPSNGLGTNSVNTRHSLLLSGATNRSGDDADLIRWVKEARAAVVRDNSTASYEVRPSDVPPDAVTSSGSGLDPHISPEYARLQVHRVAERNGLPVAAVAKLVADRTEGRALGFVGEPRVNVLALNVALRELVAKS